MKRKYLSIIVAGLLTFGLGTAELANATAISYTATNLTDVNHGEDLWQYSYSVSDNTFAVNTGFTIYFDLGLYDFLDPLPTSPNADWDILTWNPDSSIPDDGVYDAYALVDNALLTGVFTVSFVWLGGVNGPGSQFFEIYDGIAWNVLEDGFTSSGATPVPEPVTILLFGIGLAGLAGSGIKKINK